MHGPFWRNLLMIKFKQSTWIRETFTQVLCLLWKWALKGRKKIVCNHRMIYFYYSLYPEGSGMLVWNKRDTDVSRICFNESLAVFNLIWTSIWINELSQKVLEMVAHQQWASMLKIVVLQWLSSLEDFSHLGKIAYFRY